MSKRKIRGIFGVVLTIALLCSSFSFGFMAFAAADDYTALISAPAAGTVGQTVEVIIRVDGTGDDFAAAELLVEYDADKLTFNRISGSATHEEIDADTVGSLRLLEFGESRSFGNVYTVQFTAKAEGEATVTLRSAAFGTKVSAETEDLTPATIATEQATVVVSAAPEPSTPESSAPETSVPESSTPGGSAPVTGMTVVILPVALIALLAMLLVVLLCNKKREREE